MNIKAQQENIDRCRFCFMCRHVCTLGRVTNEEALTPRSQALGLSMILREAMNYDEELVKNLYKCCLCAYCKDWCQGGWDFPEAVKAARRDIVEAGLAPAYVSALKEAIIKDKNAYGKPEAGKDLAALIDKYAGKAENVLVFGSDVLYAMPEAGEAFINIMEKAGVSFTVVKDENTTAYELYALGYADAAKKSAETLADKIKATGAGRVIVLSPDVESFLAGDLNELGIDLGGAEIIGGVKVIDEWFNGKKLSFKKSYNKKVTYHDPNALARETGVTEEPRAVFAKISGCDYQELIWNKNEAHSTGSQLANQMYPELAADVVGKRVEDIREIETDVVITSSVYDKLALGQALTGEREVVDFYVLVGQLI